MIWMPIPGWQGYRASLDGQIMSLKSEEPRILKPKTDSKTGYLRIELRQDGWGKELTVHQLIALTYLGPPPLGQHVCHNDGNKLNCHAGNLRYDTPAGNVADQITHGTHVSIAIAARTRCNHGHEFTPENTYWRRGHEEGKVYRQCKRCQILATYRWRARRKGLVPPKFGANHEAARTRCDQGHLFTPENTMRRKTRNGTDCRKCKECHRQAMARYRAKKRAGAPATAPGHRPCECP